MPIEIEYKNDWAQGQGLTQTTVERGRDTTVQIDATNALMVLWHEGSSVATLCFSESRIPQPNPRRRWDAVLDFLRNLRPSFTSMIYIFEGRGFDLIVRKQVIGSVRFMPEQVT